MYNILSLRKQWSRIKTLRWSKEKPFVDEKRWGVCIFGRLSGSRCSEVWWRESSGTTSSLIWNNEEAAFGKRALPLGCAEWGEACGWLLSRRFQRPGEELLRECMCVCACWVKGKAWHGRNSVSKKLKLGGVSLSLGGVKAPPAVPTWMWETGLWVTGSIRQIFNHPHPHRELPDSGFTWQCRTI